jgi:hypothetical protein
MAAETQNLGSNSTQVFDSVANLYDVTPKQAESLVAYHGSLRLFLGSLLNASQGVGYFETRESNISKGLGLLGKVASYFSFGTSEIVAETFKEFEQFQNEDELTKVAEIATAASEMGIHKFVKQLATEIVQKSAQDLKNLTPKQAKERAREDVRNLKKQMAKGVFQDLVRDSQAANMLSQKDSTQATVSLQNSMMRTIGKNRGLDFSQSTPAKSHQDLRKFTNQIAERKQGHITAEPTHKDLGPHTHQIVAHEQMGAKNTHNHY